MSDERERLPVSINEDDDTLRASQTTKSPTGKAQRCLCVTGSIFLAALLLAAVIVLVLLLVVVGQQPARVLTSCGAVEGKFDPLEKVFSFKGIPFAAPPVGALRWQPPEPLKNRTCWKGVYYANDYKSMCMQYKVDSGGGQVQGSEDCLYLNIFTPSVDPETPLPVMVYIHGGYLQWGDGATKGYAPDERVTSQLEVVFISIQYRLNVFGFLVSEALSGRGNYGFLDQIEALHWVKENIAGFGGDPNQVTIFGQSSGGLSAWALMMSPLARGLFHRAWISSGTPVYNKTTEQAREDNAWILEEQEIKQSCPSNVTEECLLNLSPVKLLHAVYPEWNVVPDSLDIPTKGIFEPALAVVDGDLMPAAPLEMWANESYRGLYSDVPVIIGSTAQEVDMNPTPGDVLKSWSQVDLERYIAKHFDDFGMNVTNMSLALYPWEKDAEYVFTTMVSDIRCICGMELVWQKAAVALKSDIYRYIVTSFPSRPVYPLGNPFHSKYAFHTWDTYGFFWGFDQIMDNPGKSDEDFGRLMQAEIKNFAFTGKPRDSSWKGYPNTTAYIDRTLTVGSLYHSEQCNYWNNNGFFPYAWIN